MASNHTGIMNSNKQAADGLFQRIVSACMWKEYGIHVKSIYIPWLKSWLQWRQSRHQSLNCDVPYTVFIWQLHQSPLSKTYVNTTVILNYILATDIWAAHRSPIGDARIQLLALPSGSTVPSPRCVLFARNCQPIHLASPCTAVIWCW